MRAPSRIPGEWISIRPRTGMLLLGDLAIITGVLAWGLTEHGIAPLASPRYTVLVVGPFLLGWLIVAPLFGVYSQQAGEKFTIAVGTTIVGWTGAALLGAGIRATSFFPGNSPLIFILVTLGVGMIVLLPWRIGIVKLFDRDSRAA